MTRGKQGKLILCVQKNNIINRIKQHLIETSTYKTHPIYVSQTENFKFWQSIENTYIYYSKHKKWKNNILKLRAYIGSTSFKKNSLWQMPKQILLLAHIQNIFYIIRKHTNNKDDKSSH